MTSRARTCLAPEGAVGGTASTPASSDVSPGAAAPAPTNGATQGGTSTPAPQPTPVSDDALVAKMEADYAAKGSPDTGDTYAKHTLNYLGSVKARGLTLATIPPGDMERWLNESFTSVVTRNVAAAALRALITTASKTAYPMTQQVVTRKKAPPKEPAMLSQPAAHQPTNGALAAGPQVPGPGIVDPAALPIVSGTSQGTVDAAAAAAGAGPAAPPLSRPAGIQRPPNGSTQRATPVLPPLGGRVRISKRLDGYEGVSAPIGTRAVLGDYTMEDVSVEGDVMKFILNALRPHFGPKMGQPAATYYVERLDAQGNPLPGGMSAVPVFPDVVMGGMGVTGPAPAVAPAPVAAPPAPAMSPDREDLFIRYLMDNQRKAEEKYERLLETIKEKGKEGGDVGALLLLAQQAKPEPLDLDAAVARFRKSNPPPEAPVPLTPPMAFGHGLPGTALGGGLGGLDLTPPPPSSSDKMIEGLLGQVKDLNQQVRDLALRAATPPPAPPPPPQQDPVALFTAMATAMRSIMPPPPPPDPVKDALVQTALSQIGKTKSLAETLADLRAVQQFVGGGENQGPGVGEVLMTALENIDKIGAAFAGMKPPAIPARRPGSPPQRPAPAQPAAQPGATQPQRTVLPDEAKKLFKALVAVPPGEENDQQVVETLYSLLGVLSKSPDPYPLITKRVVETYLKLDTKAEIRAILTNLFVWCGAARTLMTDPVLDRLTEALHAHYTLIYSAMTNGQTRTLKDAPAATADEQPADGEQPAAPEGDVAPCGDCGHPDHGENACGYCKPDHACAQPAEPNDGDEGEEDDEEPEEPQAQPSAGTPPVAKF